MNTMFWNWIYWQMDQDVYAGTYTDMFIEEGQYA